MEENIAQVLENMEHLLDTFLANYQDVKQTISGYARELQTFTDYIQDQYDEMAKLKKYIDMAKEMDTYDRLDDGNDDDLPQADAGNKRTENEPDGRISLTPENADPVNTVRDMNSEPAQYTIPDGWLPPYKPNLTTPAMSYLKMHNVDKPENQQTMLLSPEMLPGNKRRNAPMAGPSMPEPDCAEPTNLATDDGSAPTTRLDLPAECLYAQSLVSSLLRRFPSLQVMPSEDKCICLALGQLCLKISQTNPLEVMILAPRKESAMTMKGVHSLNKLQNQWEFMYINGQLTCRCYFTIDMPVEDTTQICCDTLGNYFRPELTKL